MFFYSKIFNQEVKAADRRRREKERGVRRRGETTWVCTSSSDEGPEVPKPH